MVVSAHICDSASGAVGALVGVAVGVAVVGPVVVGAVVGVAVVLGGSKNKYADPELYPPDEY